MNVPLLVADLGVNATNYDGGAWSPYVVGAGIGILSWLTFYFADKAIGASSFYATLAGFIGKLVAHRHIESLKYYKSNPPGADWGASSSYSARFSVASSRRGPAASPAMNGCTRCGATASATASSCVRPRGATSPALPPATTGRGSASRR